MRWLLIMAMMTAVSCATSVVAPELEGPADVASQVPLDTGQAQAPDSGRIVAVDAGDVVAADAGPPPEYLV